MKNHLTFPILCATAGISLLAAATFHPTSTVSAGSSAKARGAELFATKGCAHCHGPSGIGGSEGPDLQLVRKRMNKAQIAHQIHDGGKSMPAYSDMLTSAQINDLVAYLRARRRFVPPPPKSAPVPAAPQEDGSSNPT